MIAVLELHVHFYINYTISCTVCNCVCVICTTIRQQWNTGIQCAGIRGEDEHRQLCREQFTLNSDAAGRHLQFMGRSSKNMKGGLRQKDVTTKGLKIYAQPKLGDHSIVDLYNRYFGFIPPEGPFYCKPNGSNPPKFILQLRSALVITS